MFSLVFLAVFTAAEVVPHAETSLKFYPSYAEPFDSSPGAVVSLKPDALRGPGRLWMYVEKPRVIEFTLRREVDVGFQIDKSVPQMQFSFIQVECKPEHRRRWLAPGLNDTTYRWDSPHPGFYTLDFDPGAHCAIVPVSANVPVALETDRGFVQLANGKGWIAGERPIAELDEAATKVKFEKPVNVLYIGDSLTDYDRGSNHVDTVAEYLEKHNPGMVKFWNYAKGGDCIKYVIERMDGKGKGEWKARYDGLWDRTYDIAFVLLGHNDTKTDLRNDFKIPFVTREKQRECYDDLIGRLKKHGVRRIILMSSTSSNFDVCSDWVKIRLDRAKAAGKGISLFGEPAQMEAFNAALREIAGRNGVEYMDVYEKMKVRKDKPFMVRFTDGVHLTKRGYDYIALETLRYLAARPSGGGHAVANGSFEERGSDGRTAGWTLAEGWTAGRGLGRNGGGGLAFRSDTVLSKPSFAEQVADVEPGRIYDFEAWVDGALDGGQGAQVDIKFLDAAGKEVGGAYSGTRANGRGWGRLWVRCKRLPATARKVRLRPYVPAGVKGAVSFDDISLKQFKVNPVTAMCTSHYRNEASVDDGIVTFYAGIDLADCGLSIKDAAVYFSYENPEGKIVRKKAERFDGNDALIGIWPAALKPGRQNVGVEIESCGGTIAGKGSLPFTRIASRPRRRVTIDGFKRVRIDGKPFFPVGVYAGVANSNMVERVGRSPFNTLMAYHGLNDEAMLDWCMENDLMANVHAGDYNTSDEAVGRMVGRLKNHPAVLAWLVNDEKPVSMMPRLVSRYRTVLESDGGHPAWAVLYQVDQIREYIGTCDVIGSDPYPVPHESLSWTATSTAKTRIGTFGALPLWQTSQIFDWAACKTKGTPGTDVSKYRAPTGAEMKAMAWLEVAGGANAIFMYSYSMLEKMDWRDPFEKKWAEACAAAAELADMSDVLLSDDETPALPKPPAGLSVRAWRNGAKKHVLLCNASGMDLSVETSLGNGRFDNMKTVFGGGVTRKGASVLTVNFSPTGYAMLMFDGEKPIDFKELKYNRSGGTAYLDAGVWAQPMVMDFDKDGDLDLIVLTKSALTNAFILYENPTPKGVRRKMPVFKKGRTISTDVCNGHVSSQFVDGRPIVMKPGGVMWDPIGRWGKFTQVKGVDYDPLARDTKNAEKATYRMWRLVDFDGDGLDDIVIGLDSWTRYGVLNGNAYNDKGVWTNDLLHAHVYLSRCISGRGKDAKFERAEEVFLEDGAPFETNGDPSPMLEDFDGDGDLDVVCADFTGGFWIFNNVGTRTKPKYAAKRPLVDAVGKDVRCEICMQVPLSVDWDGDGDIDIISGEEDGRVALIENLGVMGDLVRFSQPQYFRQEADDLDFGCLVTPFGCDWDGDGDWDLICGNSAGRLAFIENLSGPGVMEPSWAEPVLMSAGGETINIRAGDNGSIQGPCEKSWGYTVPSVADWDGDGYLDVMMNDIWGHVRLYRNPGRKGALDLEKPVSVDVEWEDAPHVLAWGWERPHGKEILGPWRTRSLMYDWNRDGLVDLIMLDHEGMIAYFERFRDPAGKLRLRHPQRVFSRDDRLEPLAWGSTIPRRSGRRQFCIADWTLDGKPDFLLNGGNVQLYRQMREVDGKWTFSMGGGFGKRKLAGHPSCPTVVDFDGDGVPEVVVGTEDGRLFWQLNPFAL